MNIPSYSFSDEENELIGYHRQNLYGNNYFTEPDGKIMTINITGVKGDDGREYNVPGYADGQPLTPQQARDRAKEIGWEYFPSYETPGEALEAVELLKHVINADMAKWRSARIPPPLREGGRENPSKGMRNIVGRLHRGY
jgi:hypothetical protein